MSDYRIGDKLKSLRKARKLTLQEVAGETGFSAPLISQIENDNVSPPIATLARLAKFYDVRIGYFFDDDENDCPFEVIREKDRILIPKVISKDGNYHGYYYESLSIRKKNKKMDPFILTLNDKVSDTNTYCHEGEEFLYILNGSAELVLGDNKIQLESGDGVYFDSTLKHRLFAKGDSEVKVMAIVAR